MISHPIAVLAVLAAIVFLSVRLEVRFAAARALGAALVGILLAMVAANLGLITPASPTYDQLGGIGVHLAVAFILLGVDLRSVLRAGPVMLAAFGIGAAGTAVGAALAHLALQDAIGPESAKLAAQYAGTYTGGGMNFTALGRALDTSEDLFTAAMAADIIVTALWMIACLSVPVMLGRRAGAGGPDGRTDDATPSVPPPDTLERRLRETSRSLAMGDLAAVLAVGLGAVWLSDALVQHAPAGWLQDIPQVLWITTIVLLAAQVPAIARLEGSALLGNYILLLFLAANGAQSVIKNIVDLGPEVFYFAAITVAVHGVIVFGVGPLLGIDLATLAVASQANVGGAASAIALASARGYTSCLLPGVAVGLLGYAVGTYSGWWLYGLLT